MLFHYLKIAFRNLRKYPARSLVNISGLAVGLTCFVFGVFWIHYETTYNGFFPGADRMYTLAEKSDRHEFPLMSLGNASLLEQTPEVADFTWYSMSVLSYMGTESAAYHCDVASVAPNFFDFFQWKFVEGDARSFRESPGSVVITQSLAERLFGKERVIGETLQHKDVNTNELSGDPYVISGVIKDWPKNCTFDCDFLINTGDKGYGRVGFYLLADKSTDFKSLNEKISGIPIKSFYGVENTKLIVSPIGSIHYKYFVQNNVYGINFIIVFCVAALLVLFSALFNFISLTSGALNNRLRETGLRKTLGASDFSLTGLFYVDIFLTLVISFAFSFLLLRLLCPVFTRFSGIPAAGINMFWLYISAGTFIVICLAVAFSVFRISSGSISSGKNRRTGAKMPLRQTMIALQLTISSLLLFVSLTVFRQIQLIKTNDIGINTENIAIMFPSQYLTGPVHSPAIISQIRSSPYFEEAVIGNESPVDNRMNECRKFFSGDGEESIPIKPYQVIDPGFFGFFGFRLTEGRFFGEEESGYCVINTEAARLLPADNIIGSKLKGDDREWEIAGIVETVYGDFHSERVPVVYINRIHDKEVHRRISYFVKIPPQFHDRGMEQLRNIMLGDRPEDGSETLCAFLDDLLKEKRKEEQAIFVIFGILTCICILISLFGIYSLSALSTRRRRKEIALRKVNGAETPNIIRMFFREYLRLVFIANLVALPPAWWLMKSWLENYARHIEPSWFLLLSVILLTAFIVCITVFGQVFRAARTNPAEVVKEEN